MDIPINVGVLCAGELCGRSTCLIVNPIKTCITHLIASLLLTLAIIGELLLPRHKRLPVFRTQKLAGDTGLLYLLLWLASLSMLAYIAFAFGKR